MKQLDPKAVWLFFINSLWRWFIGILFLSFWIAMFVGSLAEEAGEAASGNEEISLHFLNWLWIIIPAFFIICFIWAKLTYHFYRYELLDSGFRKESGVIYKKYVTIPYDRIQNVDISRGILARILGLSDLHIQTAGASATISRYGAMGISAEGRLPALSWNVAEQVRDELIARSREVRTQGV